MHCSVVSTRVSLCLLSLLHLSLVHTDNELAHFTTLGGGGIRYSAQDVPPEMRHEPNCYKQLPE